MDYVIVAVSLGCVYALIALGYALIYSCLRMLNFAHGEFCMIGAFSALGVTLLPGIHSWILLPAAVVGGGLAALCTWIIAYRPLKGADRASAILVAIGASICLQQVIARTVGARAQAFAPSGWDFGFTISSTRISAASILALTSLCGLFLLVHIVWTRTRFGLTVRAIADDREAAESSGIPSGRIIRWVFCVAGGAAGIAGVVLALSFSRIDPYMGFAPALKAFVAALVGGLQDPRRAALGGVTLGVAETVLVAIGLSAYRDAIVLSMLVLTLLFQARIRSSSRILQAPLVNEEGED